MSKTKKRKPLKDLNLTSRFLFDEVMEDPQAHQDALSIIFGQEVPLLSKNETEKELRVSPELRSIRMDVFSMDEDGTVYNTEMQEKRKTDLAKRSRYYQALVDTNLLEPGIPNYNLLNKSYIIIIMTFDLFGYKRYQYTFQATCMEEPGCPLEDEATRIFLCTKGENNHEVSTELADFLHYLEDTTDENAAKSGSSRIKRIHERVRKVKINEEVGVKYMQAWEEKYYEREEGRAEGEFIKCIQITLKKIKKGKSPEEIADDLEEDLSIIQSICEAAPQYDYDLEQIFDALYESEDSEDTL